MFSNDNFLSFVFLKIGRGCLGKETKKRSLMEMGKEMSEYVISTNVDLELRLSPPGVGFRAKSSHQSETSPLPSPETCILLDLNSRNHLDNSFIVGVPSLSLMGCTHCLIYVMVSEADPKCPKCKSSSYFVDVFGDNPDKRSRKRYFASSNNDLCIF
jgi:hypothetical protein